MANTKKTKENEEITTEQEINQNTFSGVVPNQRQLTRAIRQEMLKEVEHMLKDRHDVTLTKEDKEALLSPDKDDEKK